VAAAPAAASAADDLPIEDYDELKVNEILPLLDDLDLDELEAVAQHEESNKNRTTILNRIVDRMDELEAEEAGAPTTVQAAVSDAVADAAAESIEEVGEPVVALSSAAGGAASAALPIDDFDALSESEVIAELQELDADELEAIADYEEANQNRDAVLDAIDDRLDVLEGIVPAPAAPPVPVAAAAPAKKTPAKKSPAKKVAAKAAPVPVTKAAAAPVKKTAAAPAKKTATKTAAKKAAPASAKKAAAAPAKKAASAPAKKATPAKKTAAAPKKAAPVKKATAAKKATKR
jgi:hypothetical protein